MKKCRFYIADMDEPFVSAVRRTLARCQGIDIVGNSGNGRTALTECLQLKPDVVMMDIPLPELDGISLLYEFRRFSPPPAAIVCTRFYSDASMQCACRYGAAFFLCKPIEIPTLPELILECGRCSQRSLISVGEQRPEDAADSFHSVSITGLLRESGMSARLDGAVYFIEAVACCRRDEMLLRNMSRGLYALLAERMNTTVSRIERSMRSAIAIAYSQGTLKRHFTHRPTNREFIEYLLNAAEK